MRPVQRKRSFLRSSNPRNINPKQRVCLLGQEGRFPITGVGDVNTYAIFAETCLRLIRPRGRSGLIVPSGIATDNSTKDLFVEMLTKKRLISLYDFENRDAVFPGVHRSYKFCLLTLSGLPSARAEFAFFLHHTEQLRDSERRFTPSADDFALFNPNTRTCPIFRTRRDMEIARNMYRHSGIYWKDSTAVEAELNPWGGMFQSMFHMSNDSDQFRTRKWLEGEGWQLRDNEFVRGKSVIFLFTKPNFSTSTTIVSLHSTEFLMQTSRMAMPGP